MNPPLMILLSYLNQTQLCKTTMAQNGHNHRPDRQIRNPDRALSRPEFPKLS
jgi:hypothetical protein